MEIHPDDDYLWNFNTSVQVGTKPRLQNVSVTPTVGFITTDFEFMAAYFDADNDPPETDNGGYIRLFIDDSQTGIDMEWANNTNTPYPELLDRKYENGELFRSTLSLTALGDHNFYIECFDGNNTNRSSTFNLPTLVNSPPELDIPVQYVTEDVEYQLNLTDFITDIDNTTNQLIFTEDSEYCYIKDNIFLACQFSESRNGSAVVNISASDGINLAWQDVLFVIDPTNDPPVLKDPLTVLPPVSVYEDEQFIYYLGDHIIDPDTPEELLVVETDSSFVIPSGFALYMRYPHTMQFENVVVSVFDGMDMLITDLEVTVIPVNDRPELSVPPLQLIEDESGRVNLGLFITDEETAPTDLEIEVSSEHLGIIPLTGGLWFTVSYPEGVLNDYLNITVIDDIITAYQTVRVTIVPVNDPPGLISPQAQSASADQKNLYNFTVWFSDEDLISGNGVEPRVELILDGESYSLIYLEQSEFTPTNRLYGIVLGLAEGSHLFLFRCDDGSGEDNGRNTTQIQTLEIDGGKKADDDKDTATIGLDITRTGGLRELLFLLVIVIIIISLIAVNAWLFYKRRKQKRAFETTPVVAEPATLKVEPPELTIGEILGLAPVEVPKKPPKPAAAPQPVSQSVPEAAPKPAPTSAEIPAAVPKSDEDEVEPIIIYTKPVPPAGEPSVASEKTIEEKHRTSDHNDKVSEDAEDTRGAVGSDERTPDPDTGSVEGGDGE
jgi:hypothetical protein